MKDFLKTFFAVVLGLCAFSGIAVALLFGFIAILGASAAKPEVPSKAVLVFDLGTNIPDHVRDDDPQAALQRAFGHGPRELGLDDVLAALDRAADDDRIAAVYLTGNLQPQGYGAGFGALQEIRAALQRVAAKKPVVAYGMAFAKRDYYLASVGRIYLNPVGELEVNGLASEPVFYGDAFQKYGVQVQVTRVGKFKSAVEPFILDKMSPENRQQIQALLEDVWGEWKGSVAASRHTSSDALQALADTKGMLDADEAQAAGLIDGVRPFDGMLSELKKLSGKDEKAREFPQIDLGAYVDLLPGSSARAKVAVVYAEGEIVDGDGQAGQIGGDALARELRRIRQDASVKAVVLRVNSPGGSAAASDLIQREVILTRQAKPLIISMGTVAASGGYWISTYGDRIFAEPGTITGSIGVFGLLPNIQKLANDHGITFDEVSTAKMANPTTLSRPKTPEELARIQSLVDRIYDQFLSKVSESRGIPKADVNEIAQGRVWSGQRALQLHLVDEIGGLQDAVRYAAKKANLGSDYEITNGGAAKTPLQKLLESLDENARPRPVIKAGPFQQVMAQAKGGFDLLSSLNDPHGVYARMPVDLTMR
ncbi:MAG TPA: signal peptide peptidase SppA [Holophagaceae bacterium]|jgi:protease-4|nr:signal peptide peptidase SppA [Holophagaceae bacterium]